MRFGAALFIGLLSALPYGLLARGSDNSEAPSATSVSDSLSGSGRYLVTLPDGPAPTSGWPVFVLMHGYGTNKEDFTLLAEMVREHGAAAICVDAPNDLGEGRRSWDESILSTHEYLQEQIAPLRGDPRFDFEPIHVGGFSQGGIRALLLIANYETVYGGALSISPAPGSWPAEPPSATRPHPMRIVHGIAENPAMIESAEKAVAFWTQWDQPFGSFTHPGGHQFPSDWEQILGEGVDWIIADR